MFHRGCSILLMYCFSFKLWPNIEVWPHQTTCSPKGAWEILAHYECHSVQLISTDV